MSWSETAGRPAVLPELAGAAPGGWGEGPEAAARRRAYLRVRAAERQAEALVAAARAQAEERAQAGYRDGLAQGRAEALQAARGELAALGTALEGAVRRLGELEAAWRDGAAEAVVDLAVAVAERIVGEAAARPEVVRRAVRAALAALPAPEPAVVRLHPDCHAAFQAWREELRATAGLEAIPSLRLVADAAVEPGGCVVETPGCLVDATVAGQLAEARRRLREGAV